jgi:hypothetical protein
LEIFLNKFTGKCHWQSPENCRKTPIKIGSSSGSSGLRVARVTVADSRVMGHGSLGLGRKTPWPAENRLLAAVHGQSDLRKGRVHLTVYWVAQTGHVGCGSRASRSELLGSTNRRPTGRSAGNRLPSPTGDHPSEDRVL